MVSPCSDAGFDVSTGSDGSVVYCFCFCILLVLMIDGSTGSTDSEDYCSNSSTSITCSDGSTDSVELFL